MKYLSVTDIAQRLGVSSQVLSERPGFATRSLLPGASGIAETVRCIGKDGRWTYVVTTAVPGSPCKIGQTRDVEERLSRLSLSCPFPLVTLAIAAGGDFEEFLHETFRDRRLHGEWFEESAARDIVAVANRRMLGDCLACAWREEPCQMPRVLQPSAERSRAT